MPSLVVDSFPRCYRMYLDKFFCRPRKSSVCNLSCKQCTSDIQLVMTASKGNRARHISLFPLSVRSGRPERFTRTLRHLFYN